MGFFNLLGKFLMAGVTAQANWEKSLSSTILRSRKRLLILALLIVPIFLVSYALAADGGVSLPDAVGSHEAYGPSEYTMVVFLGAIVVGLIAGLITGCIGAGGGFIITPALMSIGVKGIMAVGTDLFHIFAKAIMGATLHGKMGNINVRIAAFFVGGSIAGATLGGIINRTLYERDPILSDAFITTVYVIILTALGVYAMSDYLKSRKKGDTGGVHGGDDSGEIGNLPRKLQSFNFPPMIRFDQHLVPGGNRISWIFLVFAGFIVGITAAIMGVGGGFLFFPMFVYGLGVSSTTTVGTDIFQIIFTAGYAAIAQYAVYGFIFYTLAMGMLLGSLVGIQIGAMVTKVVPGVAIRGFYAMAVLAGAVNRLFALPGKLGDMDVLPISGSVGNLLDTIGTVLFFIIVGGFGVWVITTFVRNIGVLRGAQAERHAPALEEQASTTLAVSQEEDT